jgi:hypothetical protein
LKCNISLIIINVRCRLVSTQQRKHDMLC